MKRQKIRKQRGKSGYQIPAVFLLLGISLCLGNGAAWARYEQSHHAEITFAYQAGEGQIYLEKLEKPAVVQEGETQAETEPTGIYQQEFELSNGIQEQEAYPYDQDVRLTVFATEGLQDPQNCEVTLQEGGLSYIGKASQIAEGTLFYEQYGAGWLYRFYNEAGEELSWHLPGGMLVHRKMALTVNGSSELPAAMRLIADAKPGTGKVGIPIPQSNLEESDEECLLTEEGLHMILSDNFEEKTIPIPLSAKAGILQKYLGMTGTIKVWSDQEDQLLVTADMQEITLSEESQILNLTLKHLKTEEPPKEEPEIPEDSTEDKENTENKDNTEDTGNIEDKDNTENKENTENKDNVENTENTEKKEPVTEGTETTAQLQLRKLWKLSEPIPETSENITVTVMLEIGEKQFFAKILLTSEDAPQGTLKNCQSQYDPAEPLVLTASEDGDCTLQGFLEGTRYRIDGKEYLLYQEEFLTIPAGKEAKIDVSRTELGKEGKDLELRAEGENVYKITYQQLPRAAEGEFPLIVGTEGTELSLQRQWGNAKASVSIVQLVNGEEGAAWAEDTHVTAYYEKNDRIRLLPDNGPAGTYQMIVSWKENEIILYQKEIPFFIQYDSIVLGGTENDQ